MITLVLPEAIADVLYQLTRLDVESGGVLLARMVESTSGDIRFLGNELHLVPDRAYAGRDALGLVVTSDGFVPPLRTAEERGSTAFWVHSHPGEGASPEPSYRDISVNAELSPVFRLRATAEFYGSLIVASKGAALRFSGAVYNDDGLRPIDRIWALGSRFTLIHGADSDYRSVSTVYDRNIRAFGGAIQRVLHDLRIAVVGCGGTGSCVAEQLVRLGVQRLLLIDPDVLSDSNLTRVYGSHSEDIGRPKVEVLAAHLRRISREANIEPIQSKITVERTARRLVEADLVFGCTDDNAGRLVLSRLATYFVVPVIDCGVILTSDGQGRLDGIHGRVTILHPGAACLVCRGRIDLLRAAAEALSPAEHVARLAEGYAPGLAGAEPAVVAYTTLVAAHAVGELLERLVRYGSPEVPSEIVLRVHEREISTNLAQPRERHYCHSASGKLGVGLTDPFLEQAWTA